MALSPAFGAPSRPKAGGRNGPHGLARVGRPFRARRPDSARCRRAPPGVAPNFASRALVPFGKVGKRREDDGEGSLRPDPSSSRLQSGMGSARRRRAHLLRRDLHAPSNLSVEGNALGFWTPEATCRRRGPEAPTCVELVLLNRPGPPILYIVSLRELSETRSKVQIPGLLHSGEEPVPHFYGQT